MTVTVLPAILKTLLRASEVLFAHSCLVCQSSSSQILCHRCQLPKPVHLCEGSRCTLCHERITTGEICTACEIQKPAFGHSRYLWDYSNNARDFCVALKYKPSLKLIEYAADYLSKQLPELFAEPGWDLLIPVPASRAGLEQRGFNHVELLALKLKVKADLKACISARTLVNQSNRKAQASLSDQARLKGMKNRYQISAKNSQTLVNKKVLLLDDITTTGATIAAATQTLINTGVKRVDIVTLCRSSTWYRFRNQTSLMPFCPGLPG